MAENSSAGTVAKFGLGLGAGFALYLLIRNFGFGGGFGLGGGAAGAGSTRGEGPSPTPLGPQAPPPQPKDNQPLLVWVEPREGLTQRSKLPDPTARTRDDARFLLVDLGSANSLDALHARVAAQLRDGTSPMLLDDVAARIKAGGRDDVRLMTSGAILQGTWDDAKDALMAAGIKHWLLWEERPADRMPGEPAKPPRWELFDTVDAADNPDKTGHYLVANRGTAYWNLGRASSATVSGNGRGHYRTAYRR